MVSTLKVGIVFVATIVCSHLSWAETEPIYQSGELFEAVIRGQSPSYNFIQQTNPLTPQPQTFQPGYPQPLPGQQPFGVDPFLNPGQPANCPTCPQLYGVNGPEPFRYGWTDYWEFGYLFNAGTRANGAPDNGTDLGNFRVLEIDYEKRYIVQGYNGWVWTFAPQFAYRDVNGPQNAGVATNQPNIESSFFRIGSRFQANSPSHGPWNLQLGFTPSVAADFRQNLSSDSLHFDADVVMFYRTSPHWNWAIGAAYWDRADDIVLPYAGAIWTPNQYLEIRAVFPKPRVDLFLGAPGGVATWLYAGAEYNVESYQAKITRAGGDLRDEVQFEDWRAFLGLRFDNGWMSSFIEAGAVFERKVDFNSSAAIQPFDPGEAFMLRTGFRY